MRYWRTMKTKFDGTPWTEDHHLSMHQPRKPENKGWLCQLRHVTLLTKPKVRNHMPKTANHLHHRRKSVLQVGSVLHSSTLNAPLTKTQWCHPHHAITTGIENLFQKQLEHGIFWEIHPFPTPLRGSLIALGNGLSVPITPTPYLEKGAIFEAKPRPGPWVWRPMIRYAGYAPRGAPKHRFYLKDGILLDGTTSDLTSGTSSVWNFTTNSSCIVEANLAKWGQSTQNDTSSVSKNMSQESKEAWYE